MSSDDYTFANEPVKSPSGFRRDGNPLNALDGRADQNAETAQQTRCWLTAHLTAEMSNACSQSLRALRMGNHDLRASFSKRSLLTRRVLTAKATHPQHPAHRLTADGQILGRTRIVTTAVSKKIEPSNFVIVLRQKKRCEIGILSCH
jgi:hypothetical protein